MFQFCIGEILKLSNEKVKSLVYNNQNISLLESGNTYTDDGTIPRPNQQLESKRSSTIQKVQVADGSNAYVTPETKFLRQPFTMFFADTTTAFRTKIENYITNGDTVRITTHNGETFTGKFVDMSRIWLTGVDDEFDVQVTFEWMS